MIIGIGTDMVETARIAAVLEKQGPDFLDKCYTPAERQEGCALSNPDRRNAYFAKRFAAKEAVAKAFGVGIGASLGWQDIEVVRDGRGKPGVRVTAAIAKGCCVHLSLSDEKDYALAFAVIEKTDNKTT